MGFVWAYIGVGWISVIQILVEIIKSEIIEKFSGYDLVIQLSYALFIMDMSQVILTSLSLSLSLSLLPSSRFVATHEHEWTKYSF